MVGADEIPLQDTAPVMCLKCKPAACRDDVIQRPHVGDLGLWQNLGPRWEQAPRDQETVPTAPWAPPRGWSPAPPARTAVLFF